MDKLLQDKLMSVAPKTLGLMNILNIAEDEEKGTLEPVQMFGIECNNGWFSILERLFGTIEMLNDSKPDLNVHVTQVKTKFGSLRVYMNRHDKFVEELINNAVDESIFTCEACGSKKLQNGSTLTCITCIG